VVARGDDVDAAAEEDLGGCDGQPEAAGEVLAVGRDEVDPPFRPEVRQDPLEGQPARLADDVADEEDAAGSRWTRGIAVGRVAEPGPPDGAVAEPGYFAYSTARVSRITVTLIWPG
jgi:hypothetical protein